MKQVISVLRRGQQLRRTAFRVLRQQGLRRLIKQSLSWLRGKRGYSATLIPKSLPYEAYQARIALTEDDYQRQRRYSRAWVDAPRLTLITLVNDLLPSWMIHKTVQSVQAQTFAFWQWHIVSVSDGPVAYPSTSQVANIHVTFRLGLTEAEALNQAFEHNASSSDLVVMLTWGDTLTPDALYEIAQAFRQHPTMDCLYADSDMPDGHMRTPTLRPDWSPEMMLSTNLFEALMVFRPALALNVGGIRQNYKSAVALWDFALRLTESARYIHHIGLILTHEAQSTPVLIASEELTQMLSACLQRRGLREPIVVFADAPTLPYPCPLVRWSSRSHHISIIIPSKDHADYLSRCLKSLFDMTLYESYEVIIVDTGSTETETETLYAHYATRSNFRVVLYDEPFNFSRACNRGAAEAYGDMLLFLNNDTEILHEDWLHRMVQWFDVEGVGVVGAKLLFPDGNIQHAGVIVGTGGLAGNFLAHVPEHFTSSFGSDLWYRNLLAVTGACVMLPHSLFESVGQFDEGYMLNFSDVALCLRVYEAGYRILYTPDVRLLHHESITHRRYVPRADLEWAQKDFMPYLKHGDPYFNPHLSYESVVPILNRGPHDTPLALSQQALQNIPLEKMVQV